MSKKKKVQAQQANQRRVVSVSGKVECDKCSKTFSSNTALWYHRKSIHEGVRYPCDQCDFQARRKSSLTEHILKHEGVKYSCDQCDSQFTDKSSLPKHIQTQHEGVKYTCDHCGHQTTRKEYLFKHIQSKHK